MALGIFAFLQIATHLLFVSCEAAAQESTLQDDTAPKKQLK